MISTGLLKIKHTLQYRKREVISQLQKWSSLLTNTDSTRDLYTLSVQTPLRIHRCVCRSILCFGTMYRLLHVNRLYSKGPVNINYVHLSTSDLLLIMFTNIYIYFSLPSSVYYLWSWLILNLNSKCLLDKRLDPLSGFVLVPTKRIFLHWKAG